LTGQAHTRKDTTTSEQRHTGKTAKAGGVVHLINVGREVTRQNRKYGERIGVYGLPICGAGRTSTRRGRTGAQTKTEMPVYDTDLWPVTCERCKALAAQGAAGAQRSRRQDFAAED